ncbi:MAG TPA: energy transducer TonB [Vicinamibacterales bacterium]
MPTSDCPAPMYPASLRNVDGKLDVKISVRADGTVADVAMVTAHPDQAFATAASDALRKWHFTPSEKADSTRTYSTTVFLTPPQGMPLQFGVDSTIRKRIEEHDGIVVVRGGQEWIYSALLFGDVDVTADLRASESTSALRVRAWPGSRNLQPVGYEIALGAQNDRERSPGVVTGEQLRPVTTTYDAAAAAAFRSSSDWQPIEVECIDTAMRVSLGGRLVTEAQLPDKSGGRIALGVSKGVLEVRKLHVKRLDRYRASQPLQALFPDVVTLDAPGVTRPTPKYTVRPNYTAGAMGRKVQGVVALEGIIEADGSIHRLRVVRSLDDELDIMAVEAIRKWRFAPAVREGAPIASLVDFELSFTLK